MFRNVLRSTTALALLRFLSIALKGAIVRMKGEADSSSGDAVSSPDGFVDIGI